MRRCWRRWTAGKVAGAALDVFRDEPLKDSPYFGLRECDSDAAHCRLDGRGAGGGGHPDCGAGARVSEAGRGAERGESAVAVARGVCASCRRTSTWRGGWARFSRPRRTATWRASRIGYRGALAQGKTDLVRNAAIEGVLAHSENVNRINAAAVAEERGIRLHESKVENGGAASGLSVTLHTRWRRDDGDGDGAAWAAAAAAGERRHRHRGAAAGHADRDPQP